ncbi:heat-inducible transcriptional repressor HrcA [Enterococcus timonensis]|uniref:heat-inducible transcriptional repressor HrcA n=1 Tax=Enterococcus timonensis TaxID=1852364 RepID=UPI0008DA26CD|nr:heat-inducible transcriptional repressor HrcA [Enterococcus timonensis]
MLTSRQENILRLIIQTFTTTGQPVGSKFLMEHGIQASSATIRNEMSALEQLGLLNKTHSSSGRVPSLVGLRYYVDHLLVPSAVTNEQVTTIQQAFLQPFKEIDDIIEASASILSSLTRYTAFSLGPELSERRLTGFRIVPLNARQIVAVIVTDHGNVESQIFNLPNQLSAEDLEKMVRIINERLVNQPLLSVYHKLRTEIPLVLQKYFQTPQGILNLFEQLFATTFDERVFVGGKMNLLDFQMTHDVNHFRQLITLMDNGAALSQLLERQGSDQKPTAIAIGEEIGNSSLNDLALITSNYEINGHGQGRIAILGPANMPYEKVLGLLDVFKNEMENRLSAYYRLLDGKN